MRSERAARLALGVLAIGAAGSTQAVTLHVSTAGLDSPACGAPSQPCRNIDYAANKAASGDWIKVAAGTYVYASVPNQCAGVTPPSVVCVVDKSITIRGGHSAATWAFEPSANPTVIDGQNLYRGAYVYSSISYQCLNCPASVRLTMADITIQNGRASDGGGIRVDGGPGWSAAVTLESVTLQDNQAIGANNDSGPGGAARGSALSISGVAGRFAARPAAISTLSNVSFLRNSSRGGEGTTFGGDATGTLSVSGSDLHVENSRFLDNTALGGSASNGIGGRARGGAVDLSGSIVLERVTAIGNRVTGGAGTQGGGGAFGGAVFGTNHLLGGIVSIRDSLFQSNVALGGSGSATGGSAGGGGGLFDNAYFVSIQRTRIIANRVTSGAASAGTVGAAVGGGLGLLHKGSLYPVASASAYVDNTVVAGNVVEPGPTGSNPGGGGGGIRVEGLRTTLTHLTIAANQLGAGLVAGQALAVDYSPSVALNFSVVADHVASTNGATALVVTATGNNTLNLNGGAFSGNTHNINDNDLPVAHGTIDGLGTMATIGSPSFVAPGPPSYDYHIDSGSLLRDAATGSVTPFDIDYQPRAGNGVPDVGADEYVAGTCTPGGATDTDSDGIPDTVEAAEGTHPCAKDNITTDRLFAMQQYRDFLGREGDPDGVLVWMVALADSVPQAVVVNAFFDSPEFQGTVAPVTRLYFAYFNRIPDKPGLDYWLAQYRAGMPLSTISQAFAGSPEFIGTYGSLNNTQFVTLVYNNVLGRAPDPGGLAYWTGQLNGGFMTRGQVMLGFSESAEYQASSYNRVFVTMMYYGMLRRMPEQAGFDYWVAQLNAGASALDIINGFLGAVEYRGRFLP